MTGPNASDLAEQLAQIARRKRILARMQQALTWVPLLVVIAHSLMMNPGSNLPYFHIFAIAILLSLAASLAAQVRSRDRDLAERLGQLGHPAAIGPLAEASRLPGMEHIVSVALKQLLPLLKRTDADMLSPVQRESLFALAVEDDYKPVHWASWPPWKRNRKAVSSLVHHEHFGLESFRLALLGALKELGDPAALAYVVPLCDSYSSAIRRAARECREELQKQAALLGQKQTLLRTPDSSEALLQPASAASSEEELLLRPTE